MVDIEEKDEALKSDLSPEEGAGQIALDPATVSSTSITVIEKTVVGPGSTGNMDEPEKVKDDGNEMVVGDKIDEEHNNDKDVIEGEKDEEKIKGQINGENLGESSKGKRKKPVRRNKKKKLAQKASEMVGGDGDKVNARVAVDNEVTIDEKHKEKAIGEEKTRKEVTVKEASIKEDEGKSNGGLKIDGHNKEKALTEGVKDEKKTQEQMKGESLGESSKAKGRKPRKRNKKRKLAQKASENGMTVNEGQNKEKATGEKEKHKEDAVKEASIKGEDEEKTEETKNGEKFGETSNRKGKKPKKRNKKKKVAQPALEMIAVDGDKPESSSKKKASKRAESMGMIFMCSSKTKADCFRYKILGLPTGKKDEVAKIYKGMRLFLFDVDLRLMYGIFKAAGAGGYNIEPKAFKSAFPSQVRFTVFSDCLPLAEEKFRIAIKENYYARNKFNCHLNAEQVKKLCKLFFVAGKSDPSPKKAIKNRQLVAANETRGASTAKDRKKRKRPHQEDQWQPHPPLGRDRRSHHHDYGQTPVIYNREPLLSPLDPGPRYLPAPLPPQDPAPVRSYGYERTYSYAPDPVLDHRSYSYRALDAEPRGRDEIVSRDPYHLYSREPPIYRDSVYPSVGQPVEYHRPPAAAVLSPEYRLISREYNPPPAAEYHLSGGSLASNYRDGGRTSDFRSAAASLPEHDPYRTRYGY